MAEERKTLGYPNMLPSETRVIEKKKIAPFVYQTMNLTAKLEQLSKNANRSPNGSRRSSPSSFLLSPEKRRAFSIATMSGVPEELSPKEFKRGGYGALCDSSDALRKMLDQHAKTHTVKRSTSEPILNSWDFGHRSQAFEYDYTSDISHSESICSDDDSGSDVYSPRPSFSSLDPFIITNSENEGAQRDIIFKISNG